MEKPFHPLRELFKQLGLDDDPRAFLQFIQQHQPLPLSVELHEAPFWTEEQAAFLREAQAADSDWAEVVDQLNAMLRE